MAQVLITVSLSAVTGCVAMPTEPSAADIQAGLNSPSPPAQPSLGGKLTNALTGAPVVGATVSVQGRSVVSSSTGHYGFNPDMTAGTYPLSITHPLYADVTADVEIAPYKMIDFKMQPR